MVHSKKKNRNIDDLVQNILNNPPSFLKKGSEFSSMNPADKAHIVVSLLMNNMKKKHKKFFSESSEYVDFSQEEQDQYDRYFFKFIHQYTPEYLVAKLGYLFKKKYG